MRRSAASLALAGLGGIALAAPAAAQPATAADIDRLMEVIEAQQAEIDAMRAELDAMKAGRTAAAAGSTPAPAVPPAAQTATVAATLPASGEEEAQMVAEGFTWRDRSGRSLTLSGQVNPAFNVVDDGMYTEAFIVDNDTLGTKCSTLT
jgi:hypothetical protein